MTRVGLAFLIVTLAAPALPAHAANVGAPDCVARVAAADAGVTYTNVCRSLIHVGKCISDGADGDAWSCVYVMYSPGESFSVAADQKLKLQACRAESGNCVRAVRCFSSSEPGTEKSVIAMARKCGIEF